MSGFLLDTNIPSELIRPSPEHKVTDWVNSHDTQSLYLSAITVGEIRKGFSLLPQSRRRTQLEEWFAHFLLPTFAERILAVTVEVANRWGELDAEAQRRGKPLNTADGLIAATALAHGLTIVTRNVKDFVGLGASIINPWDE